MKEASELIQLCLALVRSEAQAGRLEWLRAPCFRSVKAHTDWYLATQEIKERSRAMYDAMMVSARAEWLDAQEKLTWCDRIELVGGRMGLTSKLLNPPEGEARAEATYLAFPDGSYAIFWVRQHTHKRSR